jgi:OFA family oxalate/formate antiporter-like MFS transporter
MKNLKNRWLVALSGVGIHISIGSVYAYSVMTKPVASVLGIEGSEVKTAFMLAIFCLGMSAAFLGRVVEKIGPKKSGIATAILYGVGTIGTGIAIQVGSPFLFKFCYGVIGGIGLGIGYITPVSTLVKWFPDKRGLATGMAIMGFGFSSMIFGPLMASLFIDHMQDTTAVYTAASVANTFYIVGGIYFALIFCSSLYIAKPPEDWKPPVNSGVQVKKKTTDVGNLLAGESMKTKRFYFIWVMMFINISCGIALIASASPLVQDIFKVGATEAGLIVGMIGIFNGLGRFFWSSLSDYLGRDKTFIIFFVIQILAFFALPHLQTILMFQIVLYLIITCYGGAFAVLPAFLGDLFGTKQLGAIHGLILTAWAFAGSAGPFMLTTLKENYDGDYNKIFMVFVGCYVVALIASIFMMLDIKKKKAKNAEMVVESEEEALA